MLRTVIDLETNGLPAPEAPSPSPVSCSWITFRCDSTMEVVDSGTMYFYNPSYIILDNKNAQEAEKIHGLTKEFLSQFADQYTDNCRKLYKLIARGNLVGHNLISFDIKIAQNFLSRNGYGSPLPNSVKDTMLIFQPYFGKLKKEHKLPEDAKTRWKLGKIVEHFNIPEIVIKMVYKECFGKELEGEAYHTADFDVVACELIFRKAIALGLTKGFETK